MPKKQKISSSYLKEKIFCICYFTLFILLAIIEFKHQPATIKISIGLNCIISFAALIFSFTRKKIYFDKELFFINNWRDEEIDTVPISEISSMLFASFFSSENYKSPAYRLFYNSKEGTKKEFWIFPNWNTDTNKLMKILKENNPNLLTTDFSIGIEHLFKRREDQFR